MAAQSDASIVFDTRLDPKGFEDGLIISGNTSPEFKARIQEELSSIRPE